MRTSTLFVALIAATLAASGARAVCPGRDVLFEDRFDVLRSTWGNASDALRAEAGQLVLAPPSGLYLWRPNTASLYDDVDMCVTVTTVKAVDSADAVAGLIFWYAGVNDFYVFEIAPNGKASVWRRQRGRWLVQVRWTDAQVNTGDGTTNELRVTTVGTNATFYLNGTRFETLTGSPPEKGQQVGLMVRSPEAGTARFAFDDLRVTKP
jgi:hypothetical protein